MERALQDQFAPRSICFGCGPANDQGLRMKSFACGERVVAWFRPHAFHHAFPGVLNGGIIGSILDCHSNWTAAWSLMRKHGLAQPPCTVTADYAIQLKRPTPMDTDLALDAWVSAVDDDRATIAATLTANGKLCATCHGTFVAVKPGHPAFHGW